MSISNSIVLASCAMFAAALPFAFGGARAADAPVEAGAVHWIRDFDAAVCAAKESGKPLFVQFQEIPGCATCTGFGKDVLSRRLLVDAIESEFVPVLVHNNRGGADKAILERFGEPAWNNPVVRFLDADGKDLIPREDGVYRPDEIGRRMISALEAGKRAVPGYLRLAVEEADPRPVERATFAMHCFWEGEARLGALDGVLATRVGFIGGNEVVEATYRPDELALGDLVKKALELRCADAVYVADADDLPAAVAVAGARAAIVPGPLRDAGADDSKHSLMLSPLRGLDLTPLQATRVNAVLARGEDPADLLTPGQREALEKARGKRGD